MKWYATRSKPRKEDFLAEQLEIRRVEVFNPRVKVQRVNPRARKTRAYFPGYIFIHVDLARTGWTPVQFIPGASGIVSFGGEAADVPDGLVHAIRERVDEINAAGGETLEKLVPGKPIFIHSGPFEGYEGIFDERLPGSDRVRVLLKLLKDRHLRVDLPAGQVRLQK
jgi:transcription antitermination factor NusG